MTKEETLKILAVLRSVYPSIGKDDPESTAMVWYFALHDIGYSQVSKAVAEYIRAEHFPPVPADLIRYVKASSGEDSFRDLWLANMLSLGIFSVGEVKQIKNRSSSNDAKILLI